MHVQQQVWHLFFASFPLERIICFMDSHSGGKVMHTVGDAELRDLVWIVKHLEREASGHTAVCEGGK